LAARGAFGANDSKAARSSSPALTLCRRALKNRERFRAAGSRTDIWHWSRHGALNVVKSNSSSARRTTSLADFNPNRPRNNWI
jgi:hypothetical protein